MSNVRPHNQTISPLRPVKFKPNLFAAEAVVLCLPAVAFLVATLPEVLRLTSSMLKLQASTNPEISTFQVLLGPASWLAGAVPLVVLSALALATHNHKKFNLGPLFWLSALAGLAAGWSLVGPFGLPLAAAVVAPLLALATHCIWLQSQHRQAG